MVAALTTLSTSTYTTLNPRDASHAGEAHISSPVARAQSPRVRRRPGYTHNITVSEAIQD
jgi:hypothetical protein